MTPPGIDPRTFRLVAQRLNHYATSGPGKYMYQVEDADFCKQDVAAGSGYCLQL